MVLQSHSAKRLPKAAPQTCYQKLLSKAIAPKLQLFKSIPQNGSPKLFWKAAPESYSRKLLLKAAPRSCLQSCPRKLLFFKIIVPECYSGQFVKVIPQSGSRNCCPKLFSKASLQSSYASNLLTKASLQSGSRKAAPKVAAENYSPKITCRKVFPKAEVLQSCRTKLLLKAPP